MASGGDDNIDNGLSNSKTAVQQQQEFCNLLGFNDEIIWDRYENDEKDGLERKINLAIPLAEIPKDLPYKEKEKQLKEIEKMKKLISKIIDNIWEARKYNGGSLLMAQIFILTVDYQKYKNNIQSAISSKDYTFHTLLRVRKCINKSDSHNCCMLFVDENARVYQDWEDYKSSNTISERIIIAPEKGIYRTQYDKVILDVFESPACSVSSAFINVADKGSLIGSIGSTAVIIGSILSAPVSAPVFAGAIAVGAICGGYSTLRSGGTIYDRAMHNQSIDPINDPDARGHWIGVAGGLTGVAAGGVTSMVGTMAQNGTNVSNAVRTTVNIMNVTAVAANGIGIVHGFAGIYIKYRDDEKIETLDVVQLSASLFLFTHSVYNFRTAQNIIRTNQEQTIGGFRKDLSRNQRKMFDKMSKETVRVNGGDQGRADIIRSLKNIPDQKAFFRDVYKMNPELNKNKVRVAFGGDDKAVFNNAQKANPSEIRSNLKTMPAAEVFSNPGTIPKGKITNANREINLINPIQPEPSMIKSAIAATIIAFKVFNEEFLENMMTQLSEYMSENAFQIFMDFVKMFVEGLGSEIETNLNRIIPFEDFVSDAFKVLRSIAGENKSFSDFIEEEFNERDPMKMMRAMLSLQTYYIQYLPKGKLNGKCKKCGGEFYTGFEEEL